MQITLGPPYKVGEVLGLDGVRNLLVYSTTQYYNTIVIKCIQYKYLLRFSTRHKIGYMFTQDGTNSRRYGRGYF